MKKNIQLFLFLAMGITFIACESEYSKTVKNELQTGVVHEDLILGLKLGQTQKDFYDHCWQLNKQKLVSQGSGNKFAKHFMLLDSTAQNPEKVEMLFYGIFDEAKVMHGMHMKFSYVAWAPWNKQYQSGILIKKLQEKYLRDYGGNPFIEIIVNKDVKAYTKIDGNREILIYPNTAKEVTVKMEDLRYKLKGKIAGINQNE